VNDQKPSTVCLAPALVIVDLTSPQSLGHWRNLSDQDPL